MSAPGIPRLQLQAGEDVNEFFIRDITEGILDTGARPECSSARWTARD